MMYGGEVGVGVLVLLAIPVIFVIGMASAMITDLIGLRLAIVLGLIVYICSIWGGYRLCRENNELWYKYLENQ